VRPEQLSHRIDKTKRLFVYGNVIGMRRPRSLKPTRFNPVLDMVGSAKAAEQTVAAGMRACGSPGTHKSA
jgi:hypothetical protein